MSALLSLALLAGCGIDPAKIPSHQLYADDQAVVDAGDDVSFAVVGATRARVPRRASAEAAGQVIADLRSEAPVRGLDFIVLMGGQVRHSTTGEWEAHAARWSNVLAGETESENRGRRPVLAVPGRAERLGDRPLKGWGAAYDGIGRDIGHNRVASWSAFDVEAGGVTWRILTVDSDRKAIGSRWQEQLFWLPRALEEGHYDRLVVLMSAPWITLGPGGMDRDDGASTLLELIEDHTAMMKLHLVITGGPATNELYLPTGPYGEAVIVAGNGGVPGDGLARWGAADDAGLQDVGLETGLDVGLQGELTRWSADLDLPERVTDHARAAGSWEGFTGTYEGGDFPIAGWWQVTLSGWDVALTFRMRRHDGTFHDISTLRYSEDRGWF